jgi:hypothetical protein
MIKEILQENLNKSSNKEKINNNKLNSVLNGGDIFKQINLIKKKKDKYFVKKKKNLKLLLNNNNFFIKKATNIKAFPHKKNNTIFYRNNLISFDNGINYTTRDNIMKNERTNEETKLENDYFTDRMNSFNNQVINNLDKEFEIRCLNKKIEKLRKKNEEIKNNLKYIKNKNNTLKTYILNEENNRNNFLCSLKNIYNIFFSDEINQEEKNCEIKDLLLDLMDINYNHENAILINTFIQNLQNIIKINKIFNSNNDIYTNISDLIKIKNGLLDDINELKGNEYSEFCQKLFQIFETKDLDNIFFYLTTLISNHEDNIQKIFQMRKILFNNNNFNYEKLNTNILHNKRQNLSLNYSNLQKFNLENNGSKIKNFNLMTEKNSSFLTNRDRIIRNKNFISNLKKMNNIKRKNIIKNSKIDMDKINTFLYIPKPNTLSPNYNLNNKSILNLYNKENNKEENNENKKYIYSLNKQKESFISIKKKHKKINYNENKIPKLIPTSKRINKYSPIYY